MSKIKVRALPRVAVAVTAEPGVSMGTRRRYKFTTEELLTELVSLCERHGRPISRDDVKTACREGVLPSESVIRHHFGAIDIAVIRANRAYRDKPS